MGIFRDLAYRHNTRSVVTFDLRFKFFSNPSVKRGKQSGPAPVGRITLDFCSGDRDSEIILQSLTLRDINDRIIVIRKRLANGTYSLKFVEKIPAAIKKAVIAAKPEHFFFPTTKVLYKLFEDEEHKERHKPKSVIRLSIPEYFPMIGVAQSGVSHFFSHISYVGPLRKRPKRFYELSGEIPDAVVPQGRMPPKSYLSEETRTSLRRLINGSQDLISREWSNANFYHRGSLQFVC